MDLSKRLVVVFECVFLVCGPTERAIAQGQGTPNKIRITFTSTPTGSRFEFTLDGQKVVGTTPNTKVFTLVEGREVAVTFTKKGFEPCTRTFSAKWPRDGQPGTLVVGDDQQYLSFSAAAKPPIIACDLVKKR